MLFSNSKSTVTADCDCANNPAGRQLCLLKSNGCAVLRSSSCFKINSDFLNTIRTLSGPVSTKKSGFGQWSGKSDLIGGTGEFLFALSLEQLSPRLLFMRKPLINPFTSYTEWNRPKTCFWPPFNALRIPSGLDNINLITAHHIQISSLYLDFLMVHNEFYHSL